MPEEFENGGFTLKTRQLVFVHATPEKFKKTQQSQAAETLECTREHAHSNHHFGRHFGFVFEEDWGRQIT